MPSRSPSHRSSPVSPRSRVSSHRSPSFGMRGTSRRGRSPPSDARRRRMLPRSSATRSGESSVRGQRSNEFRNAPRSMAAGSYPQGQYSSVSGQQGSHSPRRATASKRHSYSPPISVIPSTSGLKRKRIPHARSSSTSSSSLNTPPRPQHHHQIIKMKKMSEGMASSREPPLSIPIRKQTRSKSPLQQRSHSSRAASRFSIRGAEDTLEGGPVVKGGSYSGGGRASATTVTGRGFNTSPRRHENPQKRYMAEPLVRYASGAGDERRPVYRGPDGAETTSFNEHELKKITVGILRSIPSNEPQINRQIVNPEDVVVVRRPGVSHFESISPPPFTSVNTERQGRRSEAGPSYYMSPSPPPHSRVTGFGGGTGGGRTRDYEQAGPSHAHTGKSSQSRHKEGTSRHGEDLRYELEYRRRDDTSYERGNREFRGDSDGASSDLRIRINEKRTTDSRGGHYHVDDEGGIHTKVTSERGYSVEHHHIEGPHEPRRRGMERGGGHRMGGGHSQHEDMEHEEFQPRGGFHNKASASSAPSWDGNPEYVPKGRAYYEHDNRDEEWVRMGGGPRGGRGAGHYAGATGNRGRYFRGGFVPRGRGRGRGRAFYMGAMNRGYARGGGGGGAVRRSTAHASGMGGGNSSRGKPSSPSLWKHDMFENLSSDENRPTSTTSDTKR